MRRTCACCFVDVPASHSASQILSIRSFSAAKKFNTEHMISWLKMEEAVKIDWLVEIRSWESSSAFRSLLVHSLTTLISYRSLRWNVISVHHKTYQFWFHRAKNMTWSILSLLVWQIATNNKYTNWYQGRTRALVLHQLVQSSPQNWKSVNESWTLVWSSVFLWIEDHVLKKAASF